MQTKTLPYETIFENKQYSVSSIKNVRALGVGVEGTVKPVEIKFRNGKVLVAAHKVYHSAAKEQMYHSSVVLQKKMWRDFRKAGLPVPSFFTPILRRGDSHYMSLLMENMQKKNNVLIRVNEDFGSGKPTFLSRLNPKRDKKLIFELGFDLAIIHSLGYRLEAYDIWHFFKKRNGSYGRVILDFGRIIPSTMKPWEKDLAFHQLRQYFSNSAMRLFKQAYERKQSALLTSK